MAHFSENSRPLKVRYVSVQKLDDLCRETQSFTDVCVLRLPASNDSGEYRNPLQDVGQLVADVANRLGPEATLIILGEVIDLVNVQIAMLQSMRYQLWIAIKRTSQRFIDHCSLPSHHFGVLIHTRHNSSLHHIKTRIKYTYCPVCDKTTKDYGGKKHTYHEFGTLMSDVWRDMSGNLEGDIAPIITSFADLFGVEPYKELLVFDCRPMNCKRVSANTITIETVENDLPGNLTNRVLHGDCLDKLKKISDNSIDFAFTDPPYNLGKKYNGYTDDLEITEYFDWCDRWIAEVARVLKPGRTFAILNIPLWAVRHFLFMKTILKFQNWIVWDALAFPVRLIMPAHYTILCFSKGEPRALPGLVGEAGNTNVPGMPVAFKALEPLAEGYCLRSECVKSRKEGSINDRGPLTDLWSDIHRLKHNSRRVDHPCQLPPHLMYRIISVFTKPAEVILDCFNGAGTTTLTAHQLGRKYIGIEASEKYCKMANERHNEILDGLLDPFRKEERILTAKNSPVPRLPKQKYVIPKKALQLEVRRVARDLGRLPNRDELIRYGKYPIAYYDKYFLSWGEVCAAARTTGMLENRIAVDNKPSVSLTQLNLQLEEVE